MNRDKIRVDIVIPQLAEKGGMDKVINHFASATKVDGSINLRIIQCVDTGLVWWPSDISVISMYNETDNPSFFDSAMRYREYLTSTYEPDIVLATGWPVTISIVAKAMEGLAKQSKIFAWPHMMLSEASKVGVGDISCLSEADAIFAISGQIENEVRNSGVNIPTIRINNAIEIPPKRKKSCKNIKQDNWNLLYVGRLIDSKNIDLIFRALEKSKSNWNLRILGDGEMQKTMDNCCRYGLEGKVSFEGFKDDPWESMDDTDFCIVSSNYEGFCLVIPEALSRGIPVISTPVGVAPEIIRAGINGYLYGVDDDAMLTEILDLIAEGKLPIPSAEACIESAKPYESDEVIKDFERKLIETYATLRSTKQSVIS